MLRFVMKTEWRSFGAVPQDSYLISLTMIAELKKGVAVAFALMQVMLMGAQPLVVRPGTAKAPERPQNVILMIGDGMGLAQITSGIYSSRTPLNLERFKVIGIQKTHSKSDLITDSAAGATAMARGIKADLRSFGSTLDEKAPISILEEFEERGRATGMVVTSSLSHATPAAFITYQINRGMFEAIAADYLLHDIDYLVGGGKKYFDRRHVDGRNLLLEMANRGYYVQTFLDCDFSDIPLGRKEKVIYLSADGEPLAHMQGREYFVDACARGANYLERKGTGFFLMIEGSQIDVAAHANVGNIVIDELLEFDEAVGKMLDFAEGNGHTLLVVTADHETGGMAVLDRADRELVVGFATGLHTAASVPVFAFGPGAELFRGLYDNTEIHAKMREALGWVE